MVKYHQSMALPSSNQAWQMVDIPESTDQVLQSKPAYIF